MIRFRINELLSECNEGRPHEDQIHMGHLAEAIGTARSTLAGLTTLTREPVTNTATFEAMCRFFQLNHPDFQPSLLMEFVPPLEETREVHLSQLYPLRANRGAGARRRREQVETSSERRRVLDDLTEPSQRLKELLAVFQKLLGGGQHGICIDTTRLWRLDLLWFADDPGKAESFANPVAAGLLTVEPRDPGHCQCLEDAVHCSRAALEFDGE